MAISIRAAAPAFETRLQRRTLLGAALIGNAWFRPRIARATRSPMEAVLENPKWPETFPFRADDFQRFDESPDSQFYETPRFVTHIDNSAIAALTK